jgi:hypothetical protein
MILRTLAYNFRVTRNIAWLFQLNAVHRVHIRITPWRMEGRMGLHKAGDQEERLASVFFQ